MRAEAERAPRLRTGPFKLVYKPIVKWGARRALVGRNRYRERPERGRFTRREIDTLLERSWHGFDQLVAGVPRERALGNRMNLLLACLSLALLRAFLATGVERAYAIELFADAAWKVYVQWGVVPRALARLLAHTPAERLRLCLRMFLWFPFSPPAYRYDVRSIDDGLAIDMYRCPVADYLRAQGAGDLCVGAWCNLDYALAEMWGARLDRTTTLAGGGRSCDFRFRAAEATVHRASGGA